MQLWEHCWCTYRACDSYYEFLSGFAMSGIDTKPATRLTHPKPRQQHWPSAKTMLTGVCRAVKIMNWHLQ